jgi:protein-S-isoprenylcysteine O-methyltransferase Ste14
MNVSGEWRATEWRTIELMATLKVRAWLSLAALAVAMGLLLFGSAGTLRYWQAWVYLLLFFGLSGVITLDLIRRDPALLERRMKGGPTAERRPQQRLIMVGASLGFIIMLVGPALDFRVHGGVVPLGGVVLGDALFVLGFGFIDRHGTVRRRASPDVRQRIAVPVGHPSGAWLLLGPARSCRHDAVSLVAVA